MSSYKKLKAENEILWKTVAELTWHLWHNDQATKNYVEDLKWQIRRARHEEKN